MGKTAYHKLILKQLKKVILNNNINRSRKSYPKLLFGKTGFLSMTLH